MHGISRVAVGIVVCALLSSSAGVSQAQEASDQKRADVRRLLELTGAMKIGKLMSDAMVAQMTNLLRSTHPDIPQRVLDVLPGEVNAVIGENLPAFGERAAAIYEKYYSAEDVRGLIAFYSSPLGKKVIEVTPPLTQESMLAGQKWGESLGPEIQRRIQARLKQEHVEL